MYESAIDVDIIAGWLNDLLLALLCELLQQIKVQRFHSPFSN